MCVHARVRVCVCVCVRVRVEYFAMVSLQNLYKVISNSLSIQGFSHGRDL